MRIFFLQIVRDAYSHCCCKMSKDDCGRMQLLLRKFILFSLSLKLNANVLSKCTFEECKSYDL